MDVQFTDGSVDTYDDESFARGAEGEVFRSRDGQTAIKLYYSSAIEPGRADRLQTLIQLWDLFSGASPWAEMYAWPSKVVKGPRLGAQSRYVADAVRMDHYLFQESYEDLPEAKRGTWLGRVAVAIKLARTIAQLDAQNLCHGDICPRNLMVDAASGDLVLLDCDGVIPYGAAPTGILGSREYLAPELVMGVSNRPSPLSDRHALAVTLYRWLLYRHPLFGPKRHDFDPDLDDQLALGGKALYIEHPTDRSNRPANLRISAETLTPQMRSLFQRAFVDGLRQPAMRPSAAEWEIALIELFDHTVPCPNPSCDQHHFAAVTPNDYRCPLCETPLLFPENLPCFRFSALSAAVDSFQAQRANAALSRNVIGWPGRTLYAWHFSGQTPTPERANESAQLATVEYDEGRQTWFLRNSGIICERCQEIGSCPNKVPVRRHDMVEHQRRLPVSS